MKVILGSINLYQFILIQSSEIIIYFQSPKVLVHAIIVRIFLYERKLQKETLIRYSTKMLTKNVENGD